MKLISHLLLCILVVLAIGCSVQRDDTTSTMRQLVSEQLGIAYDNATSSTTLGTLGCDDLDVVELIMAIEESFNITISDDEFESRGGTDGWQTVSVLDLANLVRKKTQP